MVFEKVKILDVPVDICAPEKIEEAMLELLLRSGTKQIIFLSVWDLLRARGNNEFAEVVQNADLVLPVSKSILWAARFLKKTVPSRHNQFTTVIEILSTMESHFKSVYLLGGRKKSLQKAESNLHETFPSLRIVGRYPGFFSKNSEDSVVATIYKSAPAFVLLSDGIKDKDFWAYRRRQKFASSIFLYYRDAVGIFSERVKRVSEKTFAKGHEIFFEVFHNPLKVFLVFPFLKFLILVLWHRIFKK